ncbi:MULTISPECIES: AraC-like transcriptional regulator QhpR [unclassified Paracoccus (in: a-proteobacteria)]|uniref:AraC-like transcriptional regulator QhpR n=1 Tax=unclassified Paracoccus (in: a-proteobacteria) TaxID=2688777 RepID=UPI0012B30ACB|nr:MULTISPECIES: AraC family transcriptional regulator [unclassified Paracoccus (in: a-proteobacteria)]UXU76644.1 AraC family transcriptional regulator [Paracoccus sp. SMMA_5]UXU82533.1 AraC family transcriptional regulator [Paracoccus sp. SMMA_5_TC]
MKPSSWIRGPFLPALLGSAEGFAIDPEPVLALDSFVRRLEDQRAGQQDVLAIWRWGEAIVPHGIGLPGQALASRRTLGEALATLARGFPLLQSDSSLTVDHHGDEVHVTYRVLDPRIWPRRADAELTLGLIRGICLRYGVTRDAVLDLGFEHPADRDLRALATYLGLRPRFDQPLNRIVLAARAMANPLRADLAVSAATEAEAALERGLNALRRQTPLSIQVQDLLLAHLDQGLVGQAQVAARLQMSERTLRRALAAEGRSFHDILAECRRIHAQALLARGELPLCEIALRLGYSDQSAFSRAFARWHGTAPRTLRRRTEP